MMFIRVTVKNETLAQVKRKRDTVEGLEIRAERIILNMEIVRLG